MGKKKSDEIVNLKKLCPDCWSNWSNHDRVQKKIITSPGGFATHNLVSCVKFPSSSGMLPVKKLSLKYLQERKEGRRKERKNQRQNPLFIKPFEYPESFNFPSLWSTEKQHEEEDASSPLNPKQNPNFQLLRSWEKKKTISWSWEDWTLTVPSKLCSCRFLVGSDHRDCFDEVLCKRACTSPHHQLLNALTFTRTSSRWCNCRHSRQGFWNMDIERVCGGHTVCGAGPASQCPVIVVLEGFDMEGSCYKIYAPKINPSALPNRKFFFTLLSHTLPMRAWASFQLLLGWFVCQQQNPKPKFGKEWMLVFRMKNFHRDWCANSDAAELLDAGSWRIYSAWRAFAEIDVRTKLLHISLKLVAEEDLRTGRGTLLRHKSMTNCLIRKCFAARNSCLTAWRHGDLKHDIQPPTTHMDQDRIHSNLTSRHGFRVVLVWKRAMPLLRENKTPTNNYYQE